MNAKSRSTPSDAITFVVDRSMYTLTSNGIDPLLELDTLVQTGMRQHYCGTQGAEYWNALCRTPEYGHERLVSFIDTWLPEAMEVRVYRICQELVQNVIKHAQATTLRIQIIVHNDSLNMMVEDNGGGLMKESMSRGFWFSTIQSNVDLFKGTFGIESQPGKGCLVLIDLPVT